MNRNSPSPHHPITPSPSSRKVIVTCAITGSIHVPSQTPYLPITPDEIAGNAIGAAEAGAAILHLHARVPETGQPTPDPEAFLRFLPRIKDETDAVINITTGGAQTMTIDERLAGPLRMKPEMCSLNMGSMNFGLYPMASRIKEFKHDWEPGYLEMSRGHIFRNTFADIERLLETMGAHGTRFEFECYDVGHLYNLAHFLDRGLVQPPLFVQTIFGILGGIGTDPEDLLHMKRTADRLLGSDYIWSILGAGRHQFNLITMGAIMGGNVRTGMEDNIYLGKGELAQSNADLVAKTVRILRELSLEPATPDEARAMLGLKGGANVAF
ncbi:MAG: 3-keto-5-aminohexanoate cleavage protein [Chloroflexia bacterium]|nr:3-keto-5-aminohexanoate cleavage protein [Chloroflexia bacterium]